MMKFVDITESKDLNKLSNEAFLIGFIDLLIANAYISPAMWARYNAIIKEPCKD